MGCRRLWFGRADDTASVRTEDAGGGHTIAIQSVSVRPGDENSVYTPMVNDKELKAQACVDVPSLPPGSDFACTIFY
ncbi:DUF2690 domain-containing protein [Streptomyces sp. NPDC056480]|uniref:DUF2690 domain-containing protein n=1 Tax=Streptomyces sp. NPDC056480 TaxID=3345833 RepID=UPI0036D0682A